MSDKIKVSPIPLDHPSDFEEMTHSKDPNMISFANRFYEKKDNQVPGGVIKTTGPKSKIEGYYESDAKRDMATLTKGSVSFFLRPTFRYSDPEYFYDAGDDRWERVKKENGQPVPNQQGTTIDGYQTNDDDYYDAVESLDLVCSILNEGEDSEAIQYQYHIPGNTGFEGAGIPLTKNDFGKIGYVYAKAYIKKRSKIEGYYHTHLDAAFAQKTALQDQDVTEFKVDFSKILYNDSGKYSADCLMTLIFRKGLREATAIDPNLKVVTFESREAAIEAIDYAIGNHSSLTGYGSATETGFAIYMNGNVLTKPTWVHGAINTLQGKADSNNPYKDTVIQMVHPNKKEKFQYTIQYGDLDKYIETLTDLQIEANQFKFFAVVQNGSDFPEIIEVGSSTQQDPQTGKTVVTPFTNYDQLSVINIGAHTPPSQPDYKKFMDQKFKTGMHHEGRNLLLNSAEYHFVMQTPKGPVPVFMMHKSFTKRTTADQEVGLLEKVARTGIITTEEFTYDDPENYDHDSHPGYFAGILGEKGKLLATEPGLFNNSMILSNVSQFGSIDLGNGDQRMWMAENSNVNLTITDDDQLVWGVQQSWAVSPDDAEKLIAVIDAELTDPALGDNAFPDDYYEMENAEEFWLPRNLTDDSNDFDFFAPDNWPDPTGYKSTGGQDALVNINGIKMPRRMAALLANMLRSHVYLITLAKKNPVELEAMYKRDEADSMAKGNRDMVVSFGGLNIFGTVVAIIANLLITPWTVRRQTLASIKVNKELAEQLANLTAQMRAIELRNEELKQAEIERNVEIAVAIQTDQRIIDATIDINKEVMKSALKPAEPDKFAERVEQFAPDLVKRAQERHVDGEHTLPELISSWETDTTPSQAETNEVWKHYGYYGNGDEIMQWLRHYANMNPGDGSPTGGTLKAPAGTGKTAFKEALGKAKATGYLPPTIDDDGNIIPGQKIPQNILDRIGAIRDLDANAMYAGAAYANQDKQIDQDFEVFRMAEANLNDVYILDEAYDQNNVGKHPSLGGPGFVEKFKPSLDGNDPNKYIRLSIGLPTIHYHPFFKDRNNPQSDKLDTQLKSRLPDVPQDGLDENTHNNVAGALYYNVYAKRIGKINASVGSEAIDFQFCKFVSKESKKKRSGNNPRRSIVVMGEYINDVENRIAKGESVTPGEDDFNQFLARAVNVSVQKLVEDITRNIETLISNRAFEEDQILDAFGMDIESLVKEMLKQKADESDPVHKNRVMYVQGRVAELQQEYTKAVSPKELEQLFAKIFHALNSNVDEMKSAEDLAAEQAPEKPLNFEKDLNIEAYEKEKVTQSHLLRATSQQMLKRLGVTAQDIYDTIVKKNQTNGQSTPDTFTVESVQMTLDSMHEGATTFEDGQIETASSLCARYAMQIDSLARIAGQLNNQSLKKANLSDSDRENAILSVYQVAMDDMNARFEKHKVTDSKGNVEKEVYFGQMHVFPTDRRLLAKLNSSLTSLGMTDAHFYQTINIDLADKLGLDGFKFNRHSLGTLMETVVRQGQSEDPKVAAERLAELDVAIDALAIASTNTANHNQAIQNLIQTALDQYKSITGTDFKATPQASEDEMNREDDQDYAIHFLGVTEDMLTGTPINNQDAIIAHFMNSNTPQRHPLSYTIYHELNLIDSALNSIPGIKITDELVRLLKTAIFHNRIREQRESEYRSESHLFRKEKSIQQIVSENPDLSSIPGMQQIAKMTDDHVYYIKAERDLMYAIYQNLPSQEGQKNIYERFHKEIGLAFTPKKGETNQDRNDRLSALVDSITRTIQTAQDSPEAIEAKVVEDAILTDIAKAIRLAPDGDNLYQTECSDQFKARVDSTSDDDDLDLGDPVDGQLKIATPEEVRAQAFTLLQKADSASKDTKQQAIMDFVKHCEDNSNIDADNITGILHRAMNAVETEAASQKINIKDTLPLKHKVAQVVYDTIVKYQTSKSNNARLEKVVALEIKAELSKTLKIDSRTGSLKDKLTAYRDALVSASTSDILTNRTSLNSTTHKRRK